MNCKGFLTKRVIYFAATRSLVNRYNSKMDKDHVWITSEEISSNEYYLHFVEVGFVCVVEFMNMTRMDNQNISRVFIKLN